MTIADDHLPETLPLALSIPPLSPSPDSPLREIMRNVVNNSDLDPSTLMWRLHRSVAEPGLQLTP
jgi:hypothetical protein